MSFFYAEVQGCRGKATRTGTKASGMWAHIRGWNDGVYVDISHNDGKTTYSIFKTSGSNGSESKELIKRFEVVEQ